MHITCDVSMNATQNVNNKNERDEYTSFIIALDAIYIFTVNLRDLSLKTETYTRKHANYCIQLEDVQYMRIFIILQNIYVLH